MALYGLDNVFFGPGEYIYGLIAGAHYVGAYAHTGTAVGAIYIFKGNRLQPESISQRGRS